MQLHCKNILITGAAAGIGAAMAQRFAAEGVAAIGIADLDLDAAQSLASGLAGNGGALRTYTCRADAGVAGDIETMIEGFESEIGPIHVMCSNAGVYQPAGAESTDANWDACWTINVMGNVRVARAVVPRMLGRGGGYIVITCSAAGLLANMDAPYMVTKHAAVAFAEWLAIQYGSRGIRVSALCPLGVRTPMVDRIIRQDPQAAAGVLAGGDLIEPDEVAQCVVAGIKAETFLLLPHESVRERVLFKARDRDRWITSMQTQYGLDVEPASS